MSLKDLLPRGTYDEILSETHMNQTGSEHTEDNSANSGNSACGADCDDSKVLMVSCPYCHKKIAYSTANPFRPFCSERCKMLDLGAWASDERRVPGKSIWEDDDADQAGAASTTVTSYGDTSSPYDKS